MVLNINIEQLYVWCTRATSWERPLQISTCSLQTVPPPKRSVPARWLQNTTPWETKWTLTCIIYAEVTLLPKSLLHFWYSICKPTIAELPYRTGQEKGLGPVPFQPTGLFTPNGRLEAADTTQNWAPRGSYSPAAVTQVLLLLSVCICHISYS